MKLSNAAYDRLKFLTQIALPALGSAYFALGSLWELGHTAQVVGTITILDTLLGVLLQINTTAYNNSPEAFDGQIEVKGYDELSHNPHLALTITTDPVDLVQGKEARIKIRNNIPPPPPLALDEE